MKSEAPQASPRFLAPRTQGATSRRSQKPSCCIHQGLGAWFSAEADKFLLGVLLATLALGFVGCATQDQDESTLPWSQPATWESNKMPGVLPEYGERSY